MVATWLVGVLCFSFFFAGYVFGFTAGLTRGKLKVYEGDDIDVD